MQSPQNNQQLGANPAGNVSHDFEDLLDDSADGIIGAEEDAIDFNPPAIST